MDSTGTVISFVVSLLALGGTILTLMANRRLRASRANQIESNAAGEVAEAALKMVAPLNDRIDKMAEQLSRMTDDLWRANQRIEKLIIDLKLRDAELEGLRGGVVVLVAQLKEVGMIARYTPPSYEPNRVEGA